MPKKVEYDLHGRRKPTDKTRPKTSNNHTQSSTKKEEKNIVPPPPPVITPSPCQQLIDKKVKDYLLKNDPEKYEKKDNVWKMKINNYVVTPEHPFITITINEIESFEKEGLNSIGFFIHEGDNINTNIDNNYRLSINFCNIYDKEILTHGDPPIVEYIQDKPLDIIINRLDNRMINNAVTVKNKDNNEEMSLRDYAFDWIKKAKYMLLNRRHHYQNEMLERVENRTNYQGIIARNENNIDTINISSIITAKAIDNNITEKAIDKDIIEKAIDNDVTATTIINAKIGLLKIDLEDKLQIQFDLQREVIRIKNLKNNRDDNDSIKNLEQVNKNLEQVNKKLEQVSKEFELVNNYYSNAKTDSTVKEQVREMANEHYESKYREDERSKLQDLIKKDNNDIAAKIELLKVDLKRDYFTRGNKELSKKTFTLIKSLEKQSLEYEQTAIIEKEKNDSKFVYNNTFKKQLEDMANTHYETHYNSKPAGGMRRRTRRRVYFMSTKRKRRNTRHKTIRKRRKARR